MLNTTDRFRVAAALAITAGSALLLAGCGGDSDLGASDSPSSLEQYDREVTPLLDRVNALATNYAGVSGENYTTDKKMYRVVYRDLPKWNAVSQELEAIESDDPDIDHAHDIVVEMVRADIRAGTLLLAALEGQDFTQVATANDELNKARDLSDDYADAMDELRAND